MEGGLVCAPVRVAVFTDYVYRQRDGRLYAERAFALFLARLGTLLDRLVLVGRYGPSSEAAPYELPPEVEFVALPYYERLGPGVALRALTGAVRQFWRALDDVDCVWLLGPHPFAVPFAIIAALRGAGSCSGCARNSWSTSATGTRDDRSGSWPPLRSRGASGSSLASATPSSSGPELARHYRHARRLLEINVSLVGEAEVVDPSADERTYDGELRVLSVGRLETEKNPLMLAEVLALLASDGRDWRLRICGEGHLEGELEAKLAELGVGERAELLGYVPFGEQLDRVYRSSHVLLHVSWTEGLPQILLEGFAAATPVVATDVGGVRDAVGDAALLIPAGDAEAAADAVRNVVDDPELRGRLRAAANRYARAHTAEAETGLVAEFLRGA